MTPSCMRTMYFTVCVPTALSVFPAPFLLVPSLPPTASSASVSSPHTGVLSFPNMIILQSLEIQYAWPSRLQERTDNNTIS